VTALQQLVAAHGSVPHLCDFFLSQGWETTNQIKDLFS
jgi:hypothetical protein